MIYHVSVKGCDTASGTAEAPFRTIGRAATIAAPGDTVKVRGGVFSRIEHNEIYNIAVKQEFWGHELGGIKIHAPIDFTADIIGVHRNGTATPGPFASLKTGQQQFTVRKRS